MEGYKQIIVPKDFWRKEEGSCDGQVVELSSVFL